MEVRLNNQQLRVLTFERERKLVDNPAFLSADSGDPDKVTTVCVEEQASQLGISVVLAVKEGIVAHVKAAFGDIFKILEIMAAQDIFQSFPQKGY